MRIQLSPGRLRGRRRAALSGVLCVVAVAVPPGSAVAASGLSPATAGATVASAAQALVPRTVIPASQRVETLGRNWKSSTDLAWTTTGDGDGLHVMVANAGQGYGWRTVATLSEPGIETDQWIGNACVTGSGRRAVVAYAPRTFTNTEALFDRGAFTAVVDLKTGAVHKLSVRTSLAYFNPSCGAGERVVLTQAGDADLGRTRLLQLNAATAKVGARIVVQGQLTSPVPTAGGIVAADSGALVTVSAAGKRRVLAATAGVAFRVAADAEGGVVYMEQTGQETASVRRIDMRAETARTKTALTPQTLASGGLAELQVASGKGGRVFVTGAHQTRKVTSSVSLLTVPVGSEVSTEGELALTSTLRATNADPRVPVAAPAAAQPVTITATVLATNTPVTFTAVPTGGGDPSAGVLTPAVARSRVNTAAGRVNTAAGRVNTAAGRVNTAAGRVNTAAGRVNTAAGRVNTAAGRVNTAGTGTGRVVTASTVSTASVGLAADPGDPADKADRYCAVPRNDPRNQAMQPKPRQVEWAVDQAVRGVLTVQRPANWKNLGMPAYSPQGYFPPLALEGGGSVPSQIMLGITAQESNMWQAARFAVPGVTANPLIGNYYGLNIYNSTEADDWTIKWADADCGYGVTQVTDGMRLSGREKPGETAMPYEKQRAVALDFAANVAAGVRILQDKWNQTRKAGMKINDGNVAKLENWFYAVWAYNSGFYPQSAAAANSGAWGVGWGNNPANPKYPAGRTPFLDDTMRDASHPQDWPYPEKVMGWAGHPVEILESPDVLVAGYRPAYWNGTAGGTTVVGSAEYNRYRVKPPINQFCNATNECEPGAKYQPNAPDMGTEPAGPCASTDAQGRYDLHCWYHGSSTWKPDCPQTCGNEILRFDPGYAYQDDGTAYPPTCAASGLPAGSIIADDVPTGTPSIRPNCTNSWTNSGSFAFSWPQDSNGMYPGKIDTHQLGVGFGGHVWMTNARPEYNSADQLLKVTGTWSFDTNYTGMGRVWVALPDTGAGDAKTFYQVKTKYGWRNARVQQKSTGTGNRWVSIGVFQFAGQPQVRLSTSAPDGNGTQRVAFDAVALQPVTTTSTVKVMHWNLAGATDRNRGEFKVVDRLVQEILAKHPDVVTLNEVCIGQFDHAVDELFSAGYQMQGDFAVAQAINHGCFNPGVNGTQAGAAILVRGEVKSDLKYAFNSDNVLSSDLPVPDLDDRIVECVIARITGTTKDAKICTTHLAKEEENVSPPWAEAEVQTKELARFFANETHNSGPFMLTGDFNIPTPPENVAMSSLYSGLLGTGDFHEAWEERACAGTSPCELQQGGPATHGSDRKLDYIFADRWNFTVPADRTSINDDVWTCNDEKKCSDHKIAYAEFQLGQ
jgi:endonuclease/exonuclease/phosphatase family metal-dependent hydrolase